MGYRRNIGERRKQRRIRGANKRVMAMLAGTAMLLAGGGVAAAATLNGQDHAGQTTERSAGSRAMMLANMALAAKRRQPASMFAYYTDPLVLAQARTATPISQVGTATVTSVNDGKPVDYDTNGSISLKIVFNPDVQFTAGQQILIHLTNGAHQPVYITSVGNARYMENAAGIPLFSVSTSNTGDLQTDTAGSDILLTALGSVVNMRNVAGSLNLNCNFSGAKIKSDLTSGTSNTITAGSNTLVYQMNPIDLSAPQWNNINPYDQSQAWAGQANHIVGYDWTGLANNVLEGKQPASDPRLAAQQIAWQHITAATPFTISAYINAMASWTSSPDQSLMSDYPDYLSDAIGMVDGVNGANISSWAEAAHTLDGHVGETLIASDGNGGYYVASNLGSPKQMPANNMDSMEPQASNNTGMAAIASRLKAMGLDYPGHWQQVVNVKFTTNTDTAQPAHSTWEIAPIGSSFNSPLTGQTVFPSANVANNAAGTPYMPPAAPAKTVGQGVYGNKMSNTTTIQTGTGEGGDALAFKDVIDSNGQAYTVSGYKVMDGSQDVSNEFEFAHTGDTVTATWKGGALPADQEFAFSFQVTPENPTGQAFTDTASVSWNNGAFTPSPQREFQTFRPSPDKTWLQYTGSQWTPASTGHAWLGGQKMGALVNGQVAAGLADAPTGFTLTDDWQDASWLFDPAALSQVKVLETTGGSMSDEDVLAHGKDVTGEFTIVRTGDTITASMKPQYLADLKGLSQPVQYSLLIPGQAWLAGGKGVDQARADYGMTAHSKDLTTCDNPASTASSNTGAGTGAAPSHSGVTDSDFAAMDADAASAFLNQGSETLSGQTVATNTPEACVTIPAEKPAVATLDLTKQVEGTATSDRFSFTLKPGDKTTSDAVKAGDITPNTSAEPAASQNKASESWTEETDKPFADGAKETVSWGAWTFYKPGVYVFNVRETGTPAKGWTYDETVHQVRISVSEDPATHDLVAETTGDDPLIVNTFKTAAPAHVITTPATPAGPQSPASPQSPDKTLAVTGAAVLGLGTLGGLLLGAGLFLKRRGTLVK